MLAKVLIIVINWNAYEASSCCLDSLAGLTYSNYEILLVDNGSSDNSADLLRLKYPSVDVLKLKSNLGFAAGCNAAFKHVADNDIKYFLLLNNDAEVDLRILDNLVSVADEYPSAGMFGAKIYYRNDPLRIWRARTIWDVKEFYFHHLGMDCIDDKGEFEEVSSIDYVNGCALFVRREVVESIGLMSEDFFMYYEEIEWSYKAKEYGYELLFVPGAKVWHRVAYSSGGEGSVGWIYLNARNECIWANRTRSINKVEFYKKKLLRLFSLFCLGTTGSYLKKHSFSNILVIICGILDAFLGAKGPCPWYIKKLDDYTKRKRESIS